ncbi:unnamed protein product [Somion occarium]|uniref:Uncharacterized protein n=1 Tax=Somion occarium TaxID=3059160 RepID=A0ABP1D6F9_9APHY
MQTLLNHSLPHSSQLSPVDDLDENTVPVNQSQCYVTPDMFPSYSLQDESSLSYFEDIFAGYIDSSAPVDATPPNGSPEPLMESVYKIAAGAQNMCFDLQKNYYRLCTLYQESQQQITTLHQKIEHLEHRINATTTPPVINIAQPNTVLKTASSIPQALIPTQSEFTQGSSQPFNDRDGKEMVSGGPSKRTKQNNRPPPLVLPFAAGAPYSAPATTTAPTFPSASSTSGETPEVSALEGVGFAAFLRPPSTERHHQGHRSNPVNVYEADASFFSHASPEDPDMMALMNSLSTPSHSTSNPVSHNRSRSDSCIDYNVQEAQTSDNGKGVDNPQWNPSSYPADTSFYGYSTPSGTPKLIPASMKTYLPQVLPSNTSSHYRQASMTRSNSGQALAVPSPAFSVSPTRSSFSTMTDASTPSESMTIQAPELLNLPRSATSPASSNVKLEEQPISKAARNRRTAEQSGISERPTKRQKQDKDAPASGVVVNAQANVDATRVGQTPSAQSSRKSRRPRAKKQPSLQAPRDGESGIGFVKVSTPASYGRPPMDAQGSAASATIDTSSMSAETRKRKREVNVITVHCNDLIYKNRAQTCETREFNSEITEQDRAHQKQNKNETKSMASISIWGRVVRIRRLIGLLMRWWDGVMERFIALTTRASIPNNHRNNSADEQHDDQAQHSNNDVAQAQHIAQVNGAAATVAVCQSARCIFDATATLASADRRPGLGTSGCSIRGCRGRGRGRV